MIDHLGNCVNCSKEIPPRINTGGLVKRFCSDRCRHVYYNRRRKRKIKKEIIEAYGRKCECCGESNWEFLTIDHINGGGREHRKQYTKDFYSVLRDLGYPKGDFRLLCINCNSSLGLYGYCPHKKGVLNADCKRGTCQSYSQQ